MYNIKKSNGKDSIEDMQKIADNNTTETLSALHTIAGWYVERFQCDETFLIDHDTSVVCASNNEMQHWI